MTEQDEEKYQIEFRPVVDQVLDAFTGGPLPSNFFRCQKCSCCYGGESIEALREHNNGLCIGCGETVGAPTAR